MFDRTSEISYTGNTKNRTINKTKKKNAKTTQTQKKENKRTMIN